MLVEGAGVFTPRRLETAVPVLGLGYSASHRGPVDVHVKNVHEDGDMPGRSVQVTLFPDFVDKDHLAVRRETRPPARPDRPLRVQEEITKKGQGQQAEALKPTGAQQPTQKNQQCRGGQKTIAGRGDFAPLFFGRLP